MKACRGEGLDDFFDELREGERNNESDYRINAGNKQLECLSFLS